MRVLGYAAPVAFPRAPVSNFAPVASKTLPERQSGGASAQKLTGVPRRTFCHRPILEPKEDFEATPAGIYLYIYKYIYVYIYM
jgi:hypothetical protein